MSLESSYQQFMGALMTAFPDTPDAVIESPIWPALKALSESMVNYAEFAPSDTARRRDIWDRLEIAVAEVPEPPSEPGEGPPRP